MKKLFSVKFLLLLFWGIVLLGFLFFCWWYGFFPDIGKTITNSYDLDSIEFIDGRQILSPEEYNRDEYADLKQQIPKMTTQALVKTYYEATRWGSDYSTTYPSCNNLELILTEGNPAIQSITAELLKRKNAGRILMKTYQKTPVLKTVTDYGDPYLWPNKVAFDYLELLLAQEEIQKHLLPWEKTELQELADQKQAEKFSEEEYPLIYAKQNYLYTDTYGPSEIYEKDDIYQWQWSEEKLEERAKPFLPLREEAEQE